jgi:predicted transcriptional regulator
MSDNYELFLNKYKEIESIVCKIDNAPSDANIFWLEENIDDINKQNKLKLCRMLRNYIQHNNDYKNFVIISNGMIEFLDEIYNSIVAQFTKNVDMMTKCIDSGTKKNIWIETDNLIDFIKFIDKKDYQYFPILSKDNKLIGMFCYKYLYSIISNDINIRKDTKINKYIQNFKINKSYIKFVSKEDFYENTIQLLNDKTNKIILVTDNGKSTGTIIGYFLNN